MIKLVNYYKQIGDKSISEDFAKIIIWKETYNLPNNNLPNNIKLIINKLKLKQYNKSIKKQIELYMSQKT